jgi:hypothetical protein
VQLEAFGVRFETAVEALPLQPPAYAFTWYQ